MGTKINFGRYLEKVKEKYGDKVEIRGEYQGKEKPISICYHCEKHGDTIKTLNAKNVFDRSFNPCAECKREKKALATSQAHKMTKEDFYNRLVEYCSDYGGEVIEKEWVSAKTVYHFKCNNPEHPVFESTADSLYSGKHWCPYCCGRKGNFEEKIKSVIESKGGELLSQYVNEHTHVEVRCKKHNNTWRVTPSNILKGRFCPVCAMSINEKTAWDWFVDNKFNVVAQYTFEDLKGNDNTPYRFDFALVDDKGNPYTIIEIDDDNHRKNNPECIEGQIRDRIKDAYCEDHNIPLYRIPIERWKITSKGREWYYNYLDSQLKFLKEMVA